MQPLSLTARIVHVVITLVIVLTMIMPLSVRISAQDEGNTPTSDTGSDERLKPGPFSDYLPGNRTLLVFEAVTNDSSLSDKLYSRMRFFRAPLLDIIPFSEDAAYKRIELLELGLVRYTFRLINDADILENTATKLVNASYKSLIGQDAAFTPEQIDLMRHGLVTINPRLPTTLASRIAPAILPSDPKTPPDTTFRLRENDTFSVDVPLDVDDTFRRLVDTGLQFDFTVYFNVKDISLLDLNFDAEELLHTERYKKLEQGGGAFVNAQQVQEIFREAVSKSDVNIIIDPGIDARLQTYAFDLFNSFIKDSVTVALNSAQEAASIDRELATGIGLNPEEFQPITLMWDVHEIVKNTDSQSAANAQLQEWYDRRKEEIETVRDRFEEKELKVKAKGSGLGLSGSSSYQELDRAFDKKETANLSETIDNGYFENEESFSEFRDQMRDATGMEVEIVARGLNVVERTTFQNSVQQAADIKISVPTNRPASFSISDSVPTNADEYQNEILPKADAVADFDSVNPNGVWSYGYKQTEFGEFIMFTQTLSSSSGILWGQMPAAWDAPPNIMHNNRKTEVSATLHFTPDTLAMHPGRSCEYDVLRWTAPIAGAFKVKGKFEALNRLTTTDVIIQVKEGLRLWSGKVEAYGPVGTQYFEETIPFLREGDVIDFMVGCGNTDYGSDSTGLTLVIEPFNAN